MQSISFTILSFISNIISFKCNTTKPPWVNGGHIIGFKLLLLKQLNYPTVFVTFVNFKNLKPIVLMYNLMHSISVAKLRKTRGTNSSFYALYFECSIMF